MRPLEIARAYIARTWSPVSIKYREKFPPMREWQTLRINHETAPQYFNGGPLNVGVILGKASNGLCDVDCDCAEALAVAPYLLPQTATIFGRAGRRHWHWLFQTNLAETRDVAVFEYDDPLCSKKAGIVELRIGGGDKGAQTVFPGSVHPSGEAIDWEEGGEPAEVDGERLHINVRKVAAAALLARYWPNGRRHDAALALGGMLAHSEWVEQQAKLFVEAVAKAAGDDEWRDRIKAVETSFAKFRASGHVAGFPTLAELVDERVARRAGEWLDVLTVFGTRKAQGAARAAAAEGKNSEIVTEDSAAIQFAELHKAELRYCHDTGVGSAGITISGGRFEPASRSNGHANSRARWLFSSRQRLDTPQAKSRLPAASNVSRAPTPCSLSRSTCGMETLGCSVRQAARWTYGRVK